MFIQHRSSRYENRRTFVTPQWNFGRVSHGAFIHGSPPVPWSPESVPHLGQPDEQQDAPHEVHVQPERSIEASVASWCISSNHASSTSPLREFRHFWRALLSMAMSVFGISSNGRLPAMDDNRRAQSLFAFATELHSRCKVLINPIKRGRHQSSAVTTSACRKCAHRPRCQQRQRRATSTSFFWILCTIMKDIWPQRAGFIPQAAPKQ